jgi:carbamoyltransferase
MTTVAHLREELRIAPPTAEDSVLSAVERVVQKRSEIPAVTHVDYSARVQTVPAQHPLAEVLEEFKARTGVGVLVNTSFNRRGEPIVRSAKDAYRCFKQTELDYLVLGAYLIARNDNQHQGAHVESDDLELD